MKAVGYDGSTITFVDSIHSSGRMKQTFECDLTIYPRKVVKAQYDHKFNLYLSPISAGVLGMILGVKMNRGSSGNCVLNSLID